MNDYIDILLRALNEPGVRHFSGEYYRQFIQCRKAEESLRDSMSKEQLALFLTYEEKSNQKSATSEWDLARQAFLLAKEIYQ